MRVHHLNCISSCPLGGKLFDGRTASLLRRGELTCHCLLVESEGGLVLIDTGFGLRDVADPSSRLSTFFLAMLKPDFREEMTALRQIERMGFCASDVRHILLSHLDFDHAGGLDDFLNATVHMLQIEREYAARQLTWLDCQRFRPQQWSTRANWQVHAERGGDTWYGFERVLPLAGFSDDIAFIHFADTHLGMRESRCARGSAGCCTRQTLIFATPRWMAFVRIAQRGSRFISG